MSNRRLVNVWSDVRSGTGCLRYRVIGSGQKRLSLADSACKQNLPLTSAKKMLCAPAGFCISLPGLSRTRLQLSFQSRIETELACEFVQVHPFHWTLIVGDQQAGRVHLRRDFRGRRGTRDL